MRTETCLGWTPIHEETILPGSDHRGRYRTVRVLVNVSHIFRFNLPVGLEVLDEVSDTEEAGDLNCILVRFRK
jgi:hypothetical protein